MYFFEKISNNFAAKIASSLNFDKDREEVIAYGAFNLFQTLWSTLLIIMFGILFDTLPIILIIAVTSATLRKFSGGAHATSPNRCAAISVIAFGILSLIVRYITINVIILPVAIFQIVSFIFTYIIIYKYCPSDSPNKPIKNPERRKKFRKMSFNILFLFTGITILLWITFYKVHSAFLLTSIVSMCMGQLWQAITMTYTGHLVINKLDAFMQKLSLRKE
jgi:accessory gene regulator B